MFLDQKRGYLQDWITQKWVQWTGKEIDPDDSDWLLGPMGDIRLIKDSFIDGLLEQENLVLEKNAPNSGLIENDQRFGFTDEETTRINGHIIDFYTKTIHYQLDFWSKWHGGFKLIGWLLSIIFSKRLQQLNIPLDPLDSTKGLESNIYKLRSQDGDARYTIWYRKLKTTGDVIYSGLYDTVYLDPVQSRCVKVVFPLPNGSATVIMKKEVLPDGSLKLTSAGRNFGDPGFYFVLRKGDRYFSRFVRSVRETIHVFVDNEGQLRTNHYLEFYGTTVFSLHYKMIRTV